MCSLLSAMLTYTGILSSCKSQRLTEDSATAYTVTVHDTVVFELESLVIQYFGSHPAYSSGLILARSRLVQGWDPE